MENVILYSSKVVLSEAQNDPNSYQAKFVICDFSRNRNGVALNRSTIDSWMETLKSQPLVGKVTTKADGTMDFTGHNMIVEEKIDEKGNPYKEVTFDTSAFGTFTDVNIEEIDGVECIVATCKIWKRFKTACEIILSRIEDGNLHTSFEVSVIDSTKTFVDGLVTKVINLGSFIGHCLLGKTVPPAFDSSLMLEISSTNNDTELIEALSHDVISENLNKKNGEKEDMADTMSKVKLDNIVAENEVDIQDEVTTDNENTDTIEVSALTEWDLRDKIREACKAKLGQWCWISYHFPIEKTVWVEADNRESELDYLLFTYEVTNDIVTVSEAQKVKLTVAINKVNDEIVTLTSEIDTKNDALIKASEEIQNLKTQVSELTPFKEKFEQVEQEKIATELAEKKEALISEVVKSGLITKEEILTSEEYKSYVDNLDSKSLKAIVAERYINSLNSESEVEVSEKKNEITDNSVATANLNNLEDEVVDFKSIMKKYIGK